MSRRIRLTLAISLCLWCGLGAVLPATQRSHSVVYAARHGTYSVYARLTCYRDSGTTYYGQPTIWGVTAGASWDIPAFATIVYPDGQTRTVTDRGDPFTAPLIDAYDPTCTIGGGSWPVSAFGDYAWVTVVEPE